MTPDNQRKSPRTVQDKIEAFRSDLRKEVAQRISLSLNQKCRSCSLDSNEDFIRVVNCAAEAAVESFLGKVP